jgi:hypothetical protein
MLYLPGGCLNNAIGRCGILLYSAVYPHGIRRPEGIPMPTGKNTR